MFTEKLRLVILELPKLPKEEDNPIWPWLRFLKCRKKEEIDMLAEKYEDLKDLAVSIRNMGLIGYWRDVRFHKNLMKTDIRMREEYVRDEAREEIARNMLKRNRPLSEIAEDTGLSPEEISKL